MKIKDTDVFWMLFHTIMFLGIGSASAGWLNLPALTFVFPYMLFILVALPIIAVGALRDYVEQVITPQNIMEGVNDEFQD